MVSGMPDFTAVMRASTTMPTGTLRSFGAMSSVNVTRAPEVQARTQIMPKFSTRMAKTKAARPIAP